MTETKTKPAGTARVVERLAELVGGAAGASSVFGAAVERNGVTIIPVARARWGFGGGSGEDEAETGKTGSGGGGGALVRPLGFIEIADGHARFRRIVDPANVAAVLLAALAVGFVWSRRRQAPSGGRGRCGRRASRRDVASTPIPDLPVEEAGADAVDATGQVRQ